VDHRSGVSVSEAHDTHGHGVGDELLIEVAGRLRAPRGTSVDAGDRVIVVDEGAERVQVFAPDGPLVDTWSATDGPGGHLLDPFDTAIGIDGTVFVVDRGHDWIQRYDADGTPIGVAAARSLRAQRA